MVWKAEYTGALPNPLPEGEGVMVWKAEYTGALPNPLPEGEGVSGTAVGWMHVTKMYPAPFPFSGHGSNGTA